MYKTKQNERLKTHQISEYIYSSSFSSTTNKFKLIYEIYYKIANLVSVICKKLGV